MNIIYLSNKCSIASKQKAQPEHLGGNQTGQVEQPEGGSSMIGYHIKYLDVNAEVNNRRTDAKRERRLRRTHTIHNGNDVLTVRMRDDEGRFVGFVELPVSEWARTLVL